MTTSPVSLTDAVRNAILYQLNGIHTAMPGQIISYDFTTQKAVVQPTVNKQWTDNSTSPMPILQDVPVIFPQSGGASLTFPVVAGDTVLIVVCERSITEWLLSGGQVTPADSRKLDLTDAVCIPGLMPFNAAFPTRANNTDAIFEYAGTTITITNTGAVKINTGSTIALGTSTVEVMQNLINVFTPLGIALSALALDPFMSSLQTATKTALTNAGLAATTSKTALATIKGTLP